MPASAAMAAAPAGVSRVTSAGPMTKNTSTSAATDSDQSKLAVPGLMPARPPADHRKCVVHSMAAED